MLFELPVLITAAIVFFFGGGWVGGTPKQFFPHCTYLASRGMVAISAEYRVKDRHGVTPLECVLDGKSAVRWVRAHASELGIDPTLIASHATLTLLAKDWATCHRELLPWQKELLG